MNNSSTRDVSGSSRSSDNLITASRNAAALVASLTGVFSRKCNFTISTRVLDRQNSPELTKVKEIVKALPQIEFQTISGFGKHLHDYYLRVGNYRRELLQNYSFIKSQPLVKQAEEVNKTVCWMDEGRDNFGAGGTQSIRQHERLITERLCWAQKEADKIQLKIRAIHILRDKTEYWQGFWDAIEDRLLPDASIAAGTPAEPVVALALWVGGLIAGGIIYDRSWEREKFLEVLETWEDKLTADYETILETRCELVQYFGWTTNAEALWSIEVKSVWLMNTNINITAEGATVYDTYLKDLELAEVMLSQTIKPFKQVLGQMHPLYGPGISVQRNVKDFCDEAPYVSVYLKKLLTAKEIISNSQQEVFRQKVHCLARLIYGHLEHIDELCVQWSKSIDPGELARFIEEETANFMRETDRVIQAIKHMLETEVCNSKTGHVLKKRTKWDRRFKSWDWNGRPLVMSAGAMEVLEDLQGIIMVIYRFSVSIGTGTNMPSMEGMVEARRAYVEFNRSNSLLQHVFRVLMEEIQGGLTEFPESREEGVTETKTSRGGWRRWIKWRRQKQKAPISGL